MEKPGGGKERVAGGRLPSERFLAPDGDPPHTAGTRRSLGLVLSLVLRPGRLEAFDVAEVGAGDDALLFTAGTAFGGHGGGEAARRGAAGGGSRFALLAGRRLLVHARRRHQAGISGAASACVCAWCGVAVCHVSVRASRQGAWPRT